MFTLKPSFDAEHTLRIQDETSAWLCGKNDCCCWMERLFNCKRKLYRPVPSSCFNWPVQLRSTGRRRRLMQAPARQASCWLGTVMTVPRPLARGPLTTACNGRCQRPWLLWIDAEPRRQVVVTGYRFPGARCPQGRSLLGRCSLGRFPGGRCD